MTHIKPFAALHATASSAQKVAALPYDVQSEEEARIIVTQNPHSFLAVDEPVVNFPIGHNQYSEEVYKKAGELLQNIKTEGSLVSDTDPHFYIYELTMDGRVQNGLVACVSADDYEKDVVKKHEFTREIKEKDRVNHVSACNAQTGPIFLAYKHDNRMSDIFDTIKQQEPLFDFVADDGVRHRGYVVPDNYNTTITSIFDDIGDVYIADGHHRIAAAAAVARKKRQERIDSHISENRDDYYESDYILATLFSDKELKIWPYERVVKDLNNHTEDELIALMQQKFNATRITDKGGRTLTVTNASNRQEAEQIIAPQKPGEFCFYLNSKWYRCSLNKQDTTSNPCENLDANLLQKQVLAPYFSIEDPRTSDRIDFVGGIRGLVELERRCALDCACAFALYETSLKELFDVADAGLVMPPKSTWFEPKLRSGLFIHEL